MLWAPTLFALTFVWASFLYYIQQGKWMHVTSLQLGPLSLYFNGSINDMLVNKTKEQEKVIEEKIVDDHKKPPCGCTIPK